VIILLPQPNFWQGMADSWWNSDAKVSQRHLRSCKKSNSTGCGLVLYLNKICHTIENKPSANSIHRHAFLRWLTGGSNRGAPAPAGVVPGVADEAAAAAARHGRRCDRAAAADHHRTGHRQRHVCHPTQSTTQGHLLWTEVTRTTTKPYHTDTIFYF